MLDENTLTIFFVLAGFVSGYRHGDEKVPFSLRDSFEFARKRIAPRYPLHLALLMLSAVLRALYVWKDRVVPDSAGLYLTKLFSNLTLTQSWFPSSDIYFSFNGVAWFLSCTVFLYFMTPLALALLRRLKGVWLAGLSALVFVGAYTRSGSILSRYFTWSEYGCNPAFVLLLYCAGLSAGVMYARLLEKPAFREARVLRAALSTAAVVLYIGFYHLRWPMPFNIPGFMPILVLLLILGLAQERGPICWLLRNPVTVHLGDISFELFMVHQVIFAYLDALVEYLWRYEIYILQAQRNALRIILSLAVAELVHWALPRFNRKLREWRGARRQKAAPQEPAVAEKAE